MPMNLARAVEILDTWRKQGRRDYVCCVSVHGLVMAQRDPRVMSAINRAGLATQDGMPLVWWSRRSGHADASRVCGPDLMEAICAVSVARNYRHYFYGGSEAVVDQLVQNFTRKYPGFSVVGVRSPPFRPLTDDEDAADVAAINEARPDFVWVGLGMPKQEKWMASHVGRIHATALLGVGAAFDFHAGVKPRAPVWMQRSGTEWMFRLASEPRRLARRYLIDNTVFLMHSVRQVLGLGEYAQDW
jgi:N-acetylglucosaminyldiphosphoundecaprenol N-acetyl-beta-D-mannosaminyltransferase